MKMEKNGKPKIPYFKVLLEQVWMHVYELGFASPNVWVRLVKSDVYLSIAKISS